VTSEPSTGGTGGGLTTGFGTCGGLTGFVARGGGLTGLVTTVGAAAAGSAGLLPLVPFPLLACWVVPETVPATVPLSAAGLVVTAPAGFGVVAGVLAGVLAAALPAPAVFDSTAAVATVRSSPVVSVDAVSGLSGEVTSCP
jgi:hypothetical protein